MRLLFTALILASSALWPVVCRGVVLDVSAGTISGGTAVDRAETSLTLRGSVNAADLDWIASNCRSLTTLDLSAVTVEPCRLDRALASGLREFPGGVLPAYSLSGLSASKVILPVGITEIGDGALLGATLSQLTIPAGVCRISTGAFAGCLSLERVRLSDGLRFIGPSTFSGCTALTSVEGSGAELTVISDRAFAGCHKLRTFSLTATAPALTEIGDEAFSSTDLRSLDLSSCADLRRVGHRAFDSCVNLEELRLPDGVTEMGDGVLFGCTSLRDFRLPSAVTRLPAMTLTGASAMQSVSGVIREGLTDLGAYSLAGMDAIEQVELPESLRRIETGAFEGWTSLGRVVAERLKSVPELGAGVWAGVAQAEADLEVADGMQRDFAAADQWKEFRISPAGESGLDMVDATDSDSGLIGASFAGSTLEVEASEQISGVAVYSIDGRLLFSTSVSSGCTLKVRTGVPTGQIYIIALRFAGGKTSGLKLLNEPLC